MAVITTDSMPSPTLAEAVTFVQACLEDNPTNAVVHGLLDGVKDVRPKGVSETVEGWQRKDQLKGNGKQNPFARTGKRASDMDVDPSPPEQIWFGVYRGAVTYLAGETGAGKSSALYNLVVHAAQDKPLWDIPFGLSRPLNVWYLDPENARTQAAWKLKRIDQGRPANLVIDSASNINLCTEWHQQCFEQWIIKNKFDLVIIDPLVNLFATADENDNAEAVRQMTFLQGVAQRTKAAILLVHHLGKVSKGSASQYGRGASARLASADVGLKWEAKADNGYSDDSYQHDEQGVSRTNECRMQITKNRLGKYGSLYLRMKGDDQFDLSTFAMWHERAEGEERVSKTEQGIDAISDLLSGGGWMSRKDILVHLKSLDIGQSKADEALREMSEGEAKELTSRRGTANRMEYAWMEWAADQPPT